MEITNKELNFAWTIDDQNYLSNKDDKMKVKTFISKICGSLNIYRKYTLGQLKSVKHCHPCYDLREKGSSAAKRLYNHLQTINTKLGERSEPTQIDESNIWQLNIKGFDEKQGYRCFGYILTNDNVFHLIFLDPDHEVYKE